MKRDFNGLLSLASVDVVDTTEISTIVVPDKVDIVEAIQTIVHCAIIATRTMTDVTSLRAAAVKATVRNLRTSQYLWLPTNFQHELRQSASA